MTKNINGFHIEMTEEEILRYFPEPTHEEQIAQLKQQLADMDYKTSKYVDGEYTDEEWREIVDERKSIRERIRELGG